MKIYSKYIKRVGDLSLSLFLIVMLFPLILIICTIQIFFYNFNIFYFQERSGLQEKPFNIVKFKTMNDVYDPSNNLLPDSDRVTRFGKLLRFFSLDEIPNLINVLLGQMSIVGPRPLPTNYSNKMSKVQKTRFAVRPGITGLAQVSGRNNLGWSEKISLDLVYLQKISFFLDLSIIAKSFFVFMGTNENKDVRHISFNNYKPNFKK